jgi:hypothetical protein
MKDRNTNIIHLDTAARQFQDAIISAYKDNCPSVARGYSRNISWWNQDLVERRRKIRRLFSAAKKSWYWTDYKRSLTEYNKALRQAKRESWRDTVRRLKRLRNVPDSRRFSQRMGRCS